MHRIAVWGVGSVYNRYFNALKLQEIQGKIRGGGIYTGREGLYERLDGYRYVPPERLAMEEIDYIVVASERYFGEIVEEAESLGFDRERILPIKIFAIPYFDFGEYVKLLHSQITIFSNFCWGGLAYNVLGMKFRTPLINMFFGSDEDYLKLLSFPKDYFEMKLEFDRWEWEYNLKRMYPVCKLGDISLHFNHYITMEEVETKWYDRVTRINYDNVFAMMATEDSVILERFSNLPYQKKICFVPFESNCHCAGNLKFVDKKPELSFGACVSGTLSGEFNDYNLISMLNSGVINHDRLL